MNNDKITGYHTFVVLSKPCMSPRLDNTCDLSVPIVISTLLALVVLKVVSEGRIKLFLKLNIDTYVYKSNF